MGTAGVGAKGMGFSYFNLGGRQSAEDSAMRDLHKIISKNSGSNYSTRFNLISGFMPFFQPGVMSSYPGPSPQQSLLPVAHKQLLMVGHPTSQQPFQPQVGSKKQETAATAQSGRSANGSTASAATAAD
ncbi:hypothetical protein R1flu_018940 [Riccia fluitans]|uniref:Uncharacterized protein n=1 Tax=Riccia fluitans TaxID=41844 RepID=A0ABD1ZIB4_9MARC